jgi:MOSC domain-containing protein YiiM
VIKTLFYTPLSGGYQQTEQLELSTSGIVGAEQDHPWRQLLLLPIDSLDKYNLTAGQLKENILLAQAENIHDLPSGSILKLGSAKLRLTFHCEPCGRLRPMTSPSKLQHQRGYLAQVIEAGEIRVGDKASLCRERMEAIPYSAGDRIEWFLKKHPQPIYALDLVQKVGLPRSYCRALPQMLKKRSGITQNLVLFKKDQ